MFSGPIRRALLNTFFFTGGGEGFAMFDRARDNGLFDSRDVAAYIAQECIQNGYSYNNTKIQKLMYCAYGAVLAGRNIRICDEYPRAWQYGPVFPKVFKAVSKGQELAQYSYTVREKCPDDIKNLINTAVRIFGKYNATALSRWSHKPGSPWEKVVHNDNFKWNDFIPDELIAKYFASHVLEASDYA